MADSLKYNNIIVGKSIPIKYRAGTVTGENLVAGTVLGKITASGKLKKVDSTASDGSQKIYGILLEDIDASTADKIASIGLTGEYNKQAMVFGGTDTTATHEADARLLQIYFEDTIRNY
mgnify:FL=1